ncbi:MAG: hypothetical protein ACJ8J0_17170 [Longimicrobiaceae bacterium]
MKKTMSGFAAAVAALVLAGSASAQVCAGFPTTDRQGTVGAFANFPSDFDQYGAEVSYNTSGPFAVNAGFIYSTADGDNLNTFRIGAAYDLTPLVGSMLPGISICPNVRADYTSESGITLWQIPIGLGFGASVPVGSPDMTLTPYVIPALYWQRFDAGAGLDDTETDFGIRGGADLNFDRFFLGGMVEWVNQTGSDAVFGVRAGIKF